METLVTWLLATGLFGLTMWQWVLIGLAILLVVIDLIKKAVKLALTVALMGIVFVVLAYLGVI